MAAELILFVIALVALASTLRRSTQSGDPDWQRRWEELPQIQRDHIAVAIRRGQRLEDPTEAELAVGYARQRREAAAALTHPGLLHLILAATLLLLAILDAPLAVLGLVLLILALLVWLAYRDRVTRRDLARAERNEGPSARGRADSSYSA